MDGKSCNCFKNTMGKKQSLSLWQRGFLRRAENKAVRGVTLPVVICGGSSAVEHMDWPCSIKGGMLPKCVIATAHYCAKDERGEFVTPH